MLAKDVLRSYESGKRDFQGVDLCEANFQGADLAGADFSQCDLRGANFARANLTGVSFRGAKLGLPAEWVIFLGIIAFGLAGAIAPIVGYCIGAMAVVLRSGWNVTGPQAILQGVAIALLYFPLALAIVRRERLATYSFTAFGVTVASTVAATVFAATAAIPAAPSAAGWVLGAILAAIVAAGITAALVGAITASAISGVANAVAGVLALMGFGIGTYGAGYSGASASMAIFYLPTLLLLGALLSFHPQSRATATKSQDPWLRAVTLVTVTTIAGTRFSQANLTDADFSATALHHVSFNNALMTRTRFCSTRSLR